MRSPITTWLGCYPCFGSSALQWAGFAAIEPCWGFQPVQPFLPRLGEFSEFYDHRYDPDRQETCHHFHETLFHGPKIARIICGFMNILYYTKLDGSRRSCSITRTEIAK